MNKKTLALSLILLTALSATIGALLIMLTASASDTTNSTTAQTSIEANASAISEVNQTMGMQPFGNYMMYGEPAFGGGQEPRFQGDMGSGMQNIEISSAYNTTVNTILSNDTDVQNLIAQGYNVTAIHPIIKSVIGADGTVTSQATTATVTMQNGTSGFATVNVDITNAKVTEITIITRTVIDKSSS